jgi:uncharacterized protein YndB with AHSA1/START domain
LVENSFPEFNPQVSDEAVQAKTGKDWASWLAVLDSAGAQQMSHKEIAAFLHEQHQIDPWWQQMVTVTYEQARGLRQKHQRPDGYQVSASKTLPVPLELLFRAWADPEQRSLWLPEAGLTVRKLTENKSLRLTWSDEASRVDVNLYPKGEGKSQVSLQHSRISNAEEAEQLKAYWKAALERLSQFLSG